MSALVGYLLNEDGQAIEGERGPAAELPLAEDRLVPLLAGDKAQILFGLAAVYLILRIRT